MYEEATIFVCFLGFGLWVYLLHMRRVNELTNEMSRLSRLIHLDEDIKEIMQAGIYHKFKPVTTDPEARQDFKKFVAGLYRHAYGGTVDTSSDIGIDLVSRSEEGVYVGQVHCLAPQDKVGVEAVALLHSQQVRQGADGAFIVTTSSFSEQALQYASDVGMELIGGEELLEMWVERIRATEEGIAEQGGYTYG